MTALQLVLIAVFGLLGTAKVARYPYMVDAAAHLGFSTEQYQLIGLAELLAVTGLLVGFAWPPAAVAAGLGLVLQMVGAVVAHVRNHDGPRHLMPALVVLLLAIAFLVARL